MLSHGLHDVTSNCPQASLRHHLGATDVCTFVLHSSCLTVQYQPFACITWSVQPSKGGASDLAPVHLLGAREIGQLCKARVGDVNTMWGNIPMYVAFFVEKHDSRNHTRYVEARRRLSMRRIAIGFARSEL